MCGIIVGLNIFLIEHSDVVENIVSRFGYVGMFLLAAVSGFNLVVPIPAIGFYPVFAELGYAPAVIIGIMSLGMTLGDSIGYLLGRTGKDMLAASSSRHVNDVFHRLYLRHQVLPFVFLFFYVAFVPLPNELLVIPMAIAGYRYWHMAVVLCLGNMLFNTFGAFGIATIVSLF
ncbi:MAG: hypothetical protein UW10_C0007G0027 [Candidatus Magasanikbacteria bacterium GW2011_GWA2_43_9]|nr:MAG: hypothetical protein UW10_C0007G0027 [Candidatus Magasanikbacteria bacterium GW2011_GWA2_43_9]